MRLHALLLAGGRSRRFGREKAVASFGAGLLMDAPLQALAAVSEAVAVSARQGSGAAAIARACDYPVLSDPHGVPDGPLAGVLAGLAWAAGNGADHLITAPCDAATLRAGPLDSLIQAAVAHRGAAMAMSPAGPEPLIAVWPVDLAYPRLARRLQRGDHPGVRALLAELGAAEVAGFDGTNINETPQLAALEQAAVRPAPDHARLFRFEDDFVRTLRCVPMCVRFKLDRVAIKLSLRQWSRLTLAERQDLRLRPCATPGETADWRERLLQLIAARSGDPPVPLAAAAAAADWRSSSTPEAVAALARERGAAAPSDARWAGLEDLQRYALVKLTRDRHENANFVPALEEFGLL